MSTAQLIETVGISKAEFESRGFRNAHPMSDLLNLCPKPGIILDCGAGAGFFSSECDRCFQGATVYSVEPVKKMFDALEFASLRMINMRGCSNMALTDFNGYVIINLTANPKSNSLLGFLPETPLLNDVAVIGTEQVKGIKLDSWMSINSVNPANVGILKMDVQGNELKLMDGCPELLKHRPIIYTEVSFQQQYRDQPLLEDVDAYLAKRGYKRLYLYASVRPDIWGDAIYVPDDSAVLEKSPEQTVSRIDAPIRLNIGAGPIVIDGFTPIDRKLGTEAFPLKYPDNSVDEIRASHILEHFSFAEVPHALEEWRRVLKPGGRLRISVPDFGKITAASSEDPMWPYYLMGGQTDSEDFHKSAFDEPRLRLYLQQAGLVNAQKWESPNTDTAAHPLSLNLEAFKPEPEAPENLTVKIKAVCSIPRIGWNDFWQSTTDALNTFGIKLETFNGVFWGQCMQRSFEVAQAQGVDWILTLDYDSMITPWHLDELFKWFGQRPDIDALCALQMRRGNDSPILTAGGKSEIEITDEPFLITTAHFGLTLIRTSCLKDLPKPWFKSQPDDKGEWGDNRLDDDIWFWHQWRLAGKNIYLAPASRIGHLELTVGYYDEEGNPQHCHVGAWREMQAAILKKRGL